ncbi:disulfide bond formation protein B [Sulfurospirillum sp. 1612]|uniref:disulfide bond formation protein B n=1 Tax=Sulfurospirillum sp. 1612 TaxID=3094835 RepID=UPI002F941A1C
MEKTSRFYTLISLAVIGIIALPVGIANIVFGYMLGDSPCTSCWSLRITMIVIATSALFIIRYGLRLKYVGMMLIAAAYGLWNAFWHLGIYAQLDMGQGQALMVFNLHTQLWAGVVMWAVILLFALILLFTGPSLQELAAEFKGQKYRKLSKLDGIAFIVFIVIVTSNAFQAFVAVGPPPFTGPDSPARFTLNPKYISWQTGLTNLFSDPSWRGPMGVSDPDLASSQAPGFEFNNNPADAPLVVNEALNIESKKVLDLPLNSPINGLRFNPKNNKFALVTEDWGLYLSGITLDSVEKHFVLDHLYFPVVLNFVGVDFMGDNIKVMGYNKAYITVKVDDNADEVAGFANFYEGADQFTPVERSMFQTVRAKTSYVGSFVADEKYSYAISVPNNLNPSFILIKQSNADGMLSAELTPEIGSGVTLKEKRTLGELYTTALAYKDGKLYAASKNFNIIVVIDTATDSIVDTYSFPSEIKNIRGMDFVDDALYVVSYQDNKNMLYILK